MKRSAFDALDVAGKQNALKEVSQLLINTFVSFRMGAGVRVDSSLLHLFTITQIFKEYLIWLEIP